MALIDLTAVENKLHDVLDLAERAATVPTGEIGPEQTIALKRGKFHLDQIAWVIGSLPECTEFLTFKAGCGCGRPELARLMGQMVVLDNRNHALLRISQWRNREDVVGTVCDLMIRILTP